MHTGGGNSSTGLTKVDDTNYTDITRDVTIGGKTYTRGDSLKGETGPSGGEYYIRSYSYPSTSYTTSYTTSYYYVVSGGYICVNSTSGGNSGSRSRSNSGISTLAWYDDNLIEYGQWSSSTSRYEEKASFRSIGINV